MTCSGTTTFQRISDMIDLLLIQYMQLQIPLEYNHAYSDIASGHGIKLSQDGKYDQRTLLYIVPEINILRAEGLCTVLTFYMALAFAFTLILIWPILNINGL